MGWNVTEIIHCISCQKNIYKKFFKIALTKIHLLRITCITIKVHGLVTGVYYSIGVPYAL